MTEWSLAEAPRNQCKARFGAGAARRVRQNDLRAELLKKSKQEKTEKTETLAKRIIEGKNNCRNKRRCLSTLCRASSFVEALRRDRE
jgi:hypothetical protein